MDTVSSTIYSLDCLVRRQQTPTLVKEHKDMILTQLGEAFELARAQPQRDMLVRKYNMVVQQIRFKNLENNLKGKMNELKAVIDEEMPKNNEK